VLVSLNQYVGECSVNSFKFLVVLRLEYIFLGQFLGCLKKSLSVAFVGDIIIELPYCRECVAVDTACCCVLGVGNFLTKQDVVVEFQTQCPVIPGECHRKSEG